MKITNKEYNQIIQEIANRIRDILYINLEEKLEKRWSQKCMENYLDDDADTELTYSYTYLVDDLRQILGRLRRKKRIGKCQTIK